MNVVCGDLHAYVDGELDDTAADGFREHLLNCDQCASDLRDVMLLAHMEFGLDADAIRALEPDAAPEPDAALRPDFETTATRSWRRFAIPMAVVAMAAALALIWLTRDHAAPPTPSPTAVALSPHLAQSRYLEGRVSHPQVNAHRPLQQQRDDMSPLEQIPPTVSAALYESGDWHGVATVELLGGNPARAAETLKQAPLSPAVDSDRALVLLMSGQPEASLELTGRIVERDPTNGPAWWNRALALRDLDLPLVAAQAFDEVSALGEPGWSEEARRRAENLRRQVTDQADSWQRALAHADDIAAGITLGASDGSIAIDLDLVAAHPGVFRKPFYLAVSTVDTRASALGLTPLADALARIHGTDAPRALLRSIESADLDGRRRAVAAFRELRTAGEALTPARRAALMRVLRAPEALASAPDVALIAMYQTGAFADDMNAFGQLAKRAGDPWFEDLRDYVIASERIARGQFSQAESLLLGSTSRCAPPSRRGLCSRLFALLVDVYQRQSRVEPMHRHAQHALHLARRDGDVATEIAALDMLGEAVRLNMRLELSRAYKRESMLRDPAHSCVEDRAMLVGIAWGYVSQGDIERGARNLAQAFRACPAADSQDTPGLYMQAANVYADLAALTGERPYIERARALLTKLRASPRAAAGDHLKADQIEGALLLIEAPERGRQVLETVIANADRVKDPGTHTARARALAFGLLIEDAFARGDSTRMLALVERELTSPGLPLPEPTSISGCVLAASLNVEQKRIRGVVRGTDGNVVGFRADHDPRTPLRADWIPTDAMQRLEGCPMVDVIARPPLPLSGSLLPLRIPWRVRMTSRRPGERTDAAHRRVIVHSVEPPAGLGLARLAPWRPRVGTAVSGPVAPSGRSPRVVEIRGRQATPTRVLDAIRDATEIEFHTHGLVDLSVSDASFLALSPDADGAFALTAGMLKTETLRARPIVTLGACRAGRTALYLHESWSLPLAFLQAGARLVIASEQPLPDAASAKFLESVRARIQAGESPARAVHAERMVWANTDRGAWANSVIVFQ